MNHGLIRVDEKHEWLLEKYKWTIETKENGVSYAYRSEKAMKVPLHRVIISLEKNDPIFLVQTPIYVDHIDGDGLNNRCENLREASPTLNQINKKIPKSNTSGYKGVHWDKNANRWRVRVTVAKNARKSMGTFECKHEAAKCYNKYTREIWGDNVVLNKIRRGND